MNRKDIEKAADQSAFIETPDARERFLFSSGFRKGAKWRINSVWHDPEETPDIDKPLLVEHVGGVCSISIIYEIDANRRTWKRWAYVKDLLPIKEDEK